VWRAIGLIVLATACGSRPATNAPPEATRVWIGGDVFLGAGGQHALSSMPAIVGAVPGIVNLEGPVGAASVDDRDPAHPRLIHDAAALAELHAAGVVVAGIANNHARDAGPDGDTQTVRALAAVDIQAAGERAGPAIVKIGSLRVVVTAHDLEAGVPERLRADLVAARRRGDVLVATFHVTGPPTYLPRPELTDAVAIAMEAGATVIAAHGTHELARVERRGHTLIAWGLGNLAFACPCTDEHSGALLEVTLDKDGAGPAAIIPIDAGLDGGATHAADDPALTFELMEALGSTHLDRRGARAWF